MQEYLVRVSRPDTAFIERVKALLSALAVEDDTKALQGKIFLVSGSLEEVIDRLTNRLIEDYRCNCEEDEGDYKFEYVAATEGFRQVELAVLTRLYSDTHSGNILYGSIIRRESLKLFSLWVNPD